MRLPTAILLFSCFTTTVVPAQGAKPTQPAPVSEAARSVTVDSDGDGLPDTKVVRPSLGVIPVSHVDLSDLAERIGLLFGRLGEAPILVPHPASGQMIVGGSPDQIESVRRLVKVLDVKPAKAAPARPASSRSSRSRRTATDPRRASDAPQTSARKGPDFTLKLDGEFVTLTVNNPGGGSLEEFVKVSQRLIELPLAYDPQEMTAMNQRIKFAGTMRVRREGFLDLFQSLLYSKSYGVAERGGEAFPHLELIFMNGPRRTELTAGARFVPFEELENYRDRAGVQILTAVPFEHINATSAAAQTRPFFAAQATQGSQLLNAPLGDDGRALLLQGYAPQVFNAARLLKAVDIPSERESAQTMLIRLEHRSAADLQGILTRMLAPAPGPRPASSGFRAVADPGTNSLALTGSTTELELCRKLVAELDVPTKKD